MSIAVDTSVSTGSTTAPRNNTDGSEAELTRLKLDLLKAEVRLAKARAGVAGAEADVKVLGGRLKALTEKRR